MPLDESRTHRWQHCSRTIEQPVSVPRWEGADKIEVGAQTRRGGNIDPEDFLAAHSRSFPGPKDIFIYGHRRKPSAKTLGTFLFLLSWLYLLSSSRASRRLSLCFCSGRPLPFFVDFDGGRRRRKTGGRVDHARTHTPGSRHSCLRTALLLPSRGTHHAARAGKAEEERTENTAHAAARHSQTQASAGT